MSTSGEPVGTITSECRAETIPAKRAAWQVRLPALSWLGWLLTIIGTIVLLWLPHHARPSQIFFWNEVLVYILFATSVNMLLGESGLVSFGQAAYFGAGAYAVALFVRNNTNETLGMILAVLIAGAFAFFAGALIMRTAGIVFAMLTLAVAQMAYTLVFKIHQLGGENGLSGVVRHSFLGISLRSNTHMYYFSLSIVLVCLLIIWWISNSPFGLILRSLREDVGRGEFLGLNVRFYQLAVFTIAGLFAGIAGVLFSLLEGYVSPDTLYWTKSADPIIMIIFGGAGQFLGPAIGAVIYQNLVHYLQGQTQAWVLYTGILLIALVLVAPGGILGVCASFYRQLRGEEAPFWHNLWRIRLATRRLFRSLSMR
jgi:branched-chain amino acid transport system permease protein